MPPNILRRAQRPALIGVAILASWVLLGTQQFANFVTLGAIYALIALGYTMVYGIIELINFAHGEVFMVGAFVAMWLLSVPLGFTGPITQPLELAAVLVVVLAVTMTVMGLIGLAIERFAYRPLRHAPRLAPLITAIGVSFILQNVIFSVFGASPVGTAQVFPFDRFEFLGGQISYLSVFILVIALALMVALTLFIGRTGIGRAMRATAQDREAAELMGVDINQTIAVTFVLASSLAGAAGVVQGLYFGSVVFNLGFYAGLKAFTAAVLGGIGNTTGAAIGGFCIAFVEVFTTALGYSRWSGAVVFGVLVLLLVFRPSGLLGKQLGERA